MRDLLGYRRMLGIVVPAVNTVAIADACRISLTGVTVHQSDIATSGVDDRADFLWRVDEGLARMRSKAPVEVALCLDEDLIEGDLAQFIAEREGDHVDAPVTLPSQALRVALERFGSSARVAVVSPFTADRHRKAVARLRDLGANVVSDTTADFADERDAARTTYIAMRALYDAAMARGEPDLLVQLGHNLPMARQVDNLEEDHGKPVLAINTVCVWHLLRRSGITDPVPGHGVLLMDH